MGKKILSIALIFISIYLLISCNESEIGVFYGLSKEEKVKNYGPLTASRHQAFPLRSYSTSVCRSRAL